jgi:hypothetical protein
MLPEKTSTIITSLTSILILVLVLCLDSPRAQSSNAKFPDAETLYRTNAALSFERFNFTSGLSPNEKGHPNGRGTQIVWGRGCGSGFLVDADGTLVTNYHVVRRAHKLIARFETGATYEIPHVRVYDSRNDLAVVKIKSNEKFAAAKLGNSDDLKVFDEVMAVGNPRCQGVVPIDGKVNQLRVDDRTTKLGLIRHTAAIAGGSSGGALYRGQEIVGVNVSGFPDAPIYFAVPINKAKVLLENPEFRNRLLYLPDVFPDDLQALVGNAKRFYQLEAMNGRIGPKAGQQPGRWAVQMMVTELHDLAFTVAPEPGQDRKNLDLLLWNQAGNLIGYGKFGESVLLSTDNTQPVRVEVQNYGLTPVNVGLKVFRIHW